MNSEMNLDMFILRRYDLHTKYYTSSKYNERRRVRIMLLDSALNISGEHFDNDIDMIHNLEIGIYNHAYETCLYTGGHLPKWSDYRFQSAYSGDGYLVQMYLKSRPDIVQKLRTGVFKATRLLYYPLWKLLPEKQSVWDIQNIRKRQIVVEKTTSDYPCPECGAREASQTQVQTRGCDEATTSTFKCKKCGHQWSEED
jgi:DNA-directed RNA polymerase subunit M/transcription elongation factor TFIIS